MKKIALLLLTCCVAVSAVIFSCSKSVNIPVSYNVVSNYDSILRDIYIPDSGKFDMQVLVKYLSGYPQDKVTLKIVGLPSDITVTPDSFSAVPTYVEDFVFTTNHAAHGTHKITIIGSAPGTVAITFTFNLTVIPADCATTLLGNMTGSNACTVTGSYTYAATGVASGTPNTLIINNFGGYGPTANATVLLNCDNDSLTIPSQTIGNGATLKGYGTFTANSMWIYYTASSTPTGTAESCSINFTK